MPTLKTKEAPVSSDKESVQVAKNIDLKKLAEKIAALLLRELEIEKERIGR